MTDELENNLRRALRPVAAPEGFAERLMKKLPPAGARPQAPVLVALPVRPVKARFNYALPSALAASLVAAVILGQHTAVQRDAAEGLAAKQELMQALRVTSQKLDLAYEAVNSPTGSSGTGAGEQENRS